MVAMRRFFERRRRSPYRSSDGVRGRGALMKNLVHSASFNSDEKDAPSKPVIKHRLAGKETLHNTSRLGCQRTVHCGVGSATYVHAPVYPVYSASAIGIATAWCIVISRVKPAR
jgi:hypothetical protein